VAVTKITPSVSGEFCRVRTDDGLELQGMYCGRSQKSDARFQKSEVSSPGPNPQSLAPNPFCLVHVHGWDGNFYENRFIDHAAQVCARQGIGFVSGNNRGHDYVADILRDRRGQKSDVRREMLEVEEQSGVRRSQKAKGKSQKPKVPEYVQLGGIYEKLADSVADIKAWIDFVVGRGAKQVILQGHSHGAIKVVHYLTTTKDPRVCGLILLSPSDDMGWAKKQLGERFLWVLARARELVRAGNGRQLLPEKDFPYPVSAATFFDCYNKGSITGIFNVSRTDRKEFPELASIRVLVLLAVGTVEEAFVGVPQKYVDDIRACMVNCPSFTGAVIDGAPHNYLGHERELGKVLSNWLRVSVPAGGRRAKASDQFAVCSLQRGTRTGRRARR
jgi:pimeloyl-ACP methyl ester carboxylesterase